MSGRRAESSARDDQKNKKESPKCSSAAVVCAVLLLPSLSPFLRTEVAAAAPSVFPHISGLVFAPEQIQMEFCRRFGIGLSLLHSHDGVSELCYFDNMKLSRPATVDDKAHATPMSFSITMASY